MKSAINNKFEEIQASEYNPRKYWLEDLFCPVCGEQVTFVQASSGARYRIAHFKHISGDYSKECELYVPYNGSYNPAVINKVQSRSERLAMIVNIKGSFFQFFIGTTFSEEELSDYESKKAELKISYLVGGQTKEETSSISRVKFSANHMERFPLPVGCKDVSVSINKKRKVIQCADGITYYRVIEIESDDTSIWARKIEKNSLMRSLYIGEEYVLVVPKHTVLRDIYNIKKRINSVPSYDLYLVEINEYNDKSVDVCRQQGYNLKDVREQFDILWPPVKSDHRVFEVNSNDLYAISNIELERDKNVCCDNCVLEDGAYRISFDSTLKISGETKEYNFSFTVPQSQLCEAPQVETVVVQEVTANNDQFYLFNSCGVHKMSVGQKTKLLLNNYVKQIYKNYTLRIYRCQNEEITYNDWISDVLKYYKITEEFNPEEVVYKGNNPYVWQYLRKIKNNRIINSYIKRKIMENTND